MIGQHGGKSAGDVAAEIAMSRLNWKGSFLMVEGATDSRFWKSRKSAQCDIVVATGRDQVLRAAVIAAQNGLDGVLGIVDDDFDTFTSQFHGVANVVSTDPRDLEGILLRSGALEKVLGEYADAQKVETFLAAEPPTIRDALLRRAEIFAKIRLINHRSQTPVALRALRPTKFRLPNTWTYDGDAIVNEAVRLGVSSDAATLRQAIARLPPCASWHSCRGHDLLLILADGLKSVLGNSELSEGTLTSCFRLGIEEHELRSTKLWTAIEAWELQSTPYKVLRK